MKFTVPEPGVNMPPLLVQLPLTLVFAPAVKVPAVRVTLPLTLSVAGAVKLPVVSVRFWTVSVVVDPETLNVVPTVFATGRL